MASVCLSQSSFVLLFIAVLVIVATAVGVSSRYWKNAVCPPCEPCKEYKCTIPAPAAAEVMSLPAVAPPIIPPLALNTSATPGRAREPPLVAVGNMAPKKPGRPYINSGDTGWYELGFVNSEGGKKNMMRLFGRRRFARTDRYEYFLSTKDGIRVPFNTPKDVELMSGDKVEIPGFEDKFIAVIYPVDVPQYSPFE